MAGRDSDENFGGMFDGRLDVRPPVTEAQLAAVPAKRGVFLLSTRTGQPIVLATAASIRARLRSRLDEPDPRKTKRSADLRAITASVRWKLASGHFETDWHYLELARAIWPKTYAKLLAWRPAWFVRVDAGEAVPHFARTREVSGGSGELLGPFPSGRSAERFIETVQDAFDLCRDVQCLRRSPHAERCAYGQMGRCLCPCDGTISMDAYRSAVAEAAEFAAGRRRRHRERLDRRMREAAAALEYERAAAVKARLQRLDELDSPAYEHVAPVAAFRFLIVQPSGSRKSVKVFLACGGSIAAAEPMDYPPVEKQLRRTLNRMARHAAAASKRPIDPAGRWRVGLVAHYLFSSERRRGLMLRWREQMAAGELSAAIEAAAAPLGVAPRKARPTPRRDTEGESDNHPHPTGRSH